MRYLVVSIIAIMPACAQWTLQRSHTSASLRGIHNVGGGVVWASGTQGTVLHTVDDGQTWETCAVPQGAEKLDFRGIQAFDANTAVVMSSGLGDLSRLYKTKDACRTWKLVFTNPDKSGFWDALQFACTLACCSEIRWTGTFLCFSALTGASPGSSSIQRRWRRTIRINLFSPRAIRRFLWMRKTESFT